MRKSVDPPTLEADTQHSVRPSEEKNELALLAQFMSHDSVVSLAKAIAKRKGVRSGDLIAAAGLGPSRTDSAPGG